MRYVIIYTNDRIVQGYRVYYLVSKVNVFSQGKVQRVTPTYPMQVLTVEFYHHVGRVLGRQFHSCGELLEKWFEKTIVNSHFEAWVNEKLKPKMRRF